MRIHSLTIDNVRAVEHLELTDVPDTGVILIHGDNEAGKSTILDALDAVLNIKHTSTKIRKLNPIGRDELPEVRLNATVGPYTFEIYKRFAKGAKGKAELRITAPRHEELTGEQAHDRLTEILSRHIDQELMKALFLRQGAFPDAVEAAGIPTFTRALEAQGGGSAADAVDDSGLMGRVEEEYLRYFTKTGKEGKDLKEADDAVVAADDAVATAEENKRAYESAVDAYTRHGAEMTAAEAEIPEAEQMLARRESEAEAARKVAGLYAEAQDKAERAATDRERATADIDTRGGIVARVEQAERVLAELKAQLEPAREKAAAETQALEDAEAEHAHATEQVAAARKAVEEAEHALNAATARARVAELEETVSRLDATDTEIAHLVKAQPQRPVTDSDVRALEQAASDLAVQQRLAEASAARMDIAGPEGSTVTVDGSAVDSGSSISLFDATEILIGDITLTYRAAEGSTSSTAALEDAQAEVDRLHKMIGCSGLEEARQLRDEHRESAAALHAARTRRAEILRGDEADDLREELARLRESADPSEDVLSVEEAQAALEDARRAETSAREELHTLDVTITPLRAKPDGRVLTELETRIEWQDSNTAAVREELAAARSKVSDDALDSARTAAEEALDAANAQLAELKTQVDQVDPERAEERLLGERNRLEAIQRRYNAARENRLMLENRVHSAEGEAEKLAQAEDALTAATVRRDQLRRRADAAKLLRDTLVTHRDAARAKYAAPFAQALQRYASRVFGPGTEFTLDESLRVQARTVDGTTVDLSELSGGAKEQMALLTRFAIADLVATNDAESMPVPVVVDDALGATDPNRLEAMNALFTKVGESSQVIVLTCFPQRFDRVAPAKTASVQELKGGRADL